MKSLHHYETLVHLIPILEQRQRQLEASYPGHGSRLKGVKPWYETKGYEDNMALSSV